MTKSRVLAACAAAAMLVAACGRASTVTATTKTVKVAVVPALAFAPLYVAKHEGFFARQKLNVVFETLRRSSEAIPALESGRVGVLGGAPSSALLNVIGRARDVKVVADRGHFGPANAPCSYVAFVASPRVLDSGKLRRPEDLKGKRVSVNTKSSSGFAAELVLDRAGLKLKDVNIVDVPDETIVNAMGGAVDVASVPEPWITRIKDAGTGRVWIGEETVRPNAQFGVLAFGTALLKDDPDAGRRFMVAYLQGVRAYNKGKTDENVAAIAAETELAPQLVRRLCWPQMRGDGRLNWESVNALQTWYVRSDLIDRALTENEFWTTSFIDYANRELGKQ
jgi:ABC-type nitrate/sulfonate/bicarbonate transport system substrate-binding protein